MTTEEFCMGILYYILLVLTIEGIVLLTGIIVDMLCTTLFNKTLAGVIEELRRGDTK